MLRISKSGIESIHFAPEKQHQYCVFEHVYFARPDSVVFGRPVDRSRERWAVCWRASILLIADIVVPCARFRRARRHRLCRSNPASHSAWA